MLLLFLRLQENQFQRLRTSSPPPLPPLPPRPRPPPPPDCCNRLDSQIGGHQCRQKRSSSRKRREHFTPTKEIGKYLNRTERSLNPARWEQCKRHFWLFDGLPTRRLHYSFTSMFNFTTNSWPLRHILETIDVSPVNRPLRINAMAVLNSNFESNFE